MCKNSQYYHDIGNKELIMLNTMKKHSKGYSECQIQQAKLAQEFQVKVRHPIMCELKNIMKNNLIANCPMTIADIDHTEKIYVPSVPILKGKTIRKAPDKVISDYIVVPPSILSANQDLVTFSL